MFSFLAINYLRKTTKKIISQADLVALGNVVPGRVVEVRKLRTKNKISYEFIIEGNDLFGNNRRYVSERFDFGGENNILVGDEISVYLDANNPEHYYVDIFSGKIK